MSGLIYLCLSVQTIPFLVFQLQSKWVAGVLSGRLELPSQEAMMRDVEAFYSEMEAHGCPKRRSHDLGQGNPVRIYAYILAFIHVHIHNQLQ